MTGAAAAAAALCSCNLASYPGDGVTVGGAALAGAVNAPPQRTTTAAMAQLAQNRIISFLPGADAESVHGRCCEIRFRSSRFQGSQHD
jgi:hypothetical protein